MCVSLSHELWECRVRTAKEGEDLEAIKEKTEALSKVVQKIGEHMSAQGGGSSDSGASSSSGESSGGSSEGNKASGG